KSDSSARFEKGVDYFSVDAGRERALALMCELGVGDILDTVCDCSVPLPKNKTVNTSAAQISNVLGIKIPGEKIIQILSPLGFKARVRGDKMSVSVPQWREDIDAYPDLAEEVIRFYGYDKIKPTMFCAGLVAVGGYPERDKKLFAVKAAMQGFGAREIITYSFLNPKVFDMLKMPAGDGLRKAIPVTNPLSEEFSVMRTELASSMLNAVKLNVSRRNDAFRLFEIGRAYKAAALPLTPTNMPSENETLCIAYVGKDEDFYKLKSAAAELLSNLLKVKEVSFFPTDCPWLHPGIGAKVAAGFTSDKGANRIELGNIGKIHPEVAKSFEVPEGTYIAEICLESLISHTMPDIRYKCLPKFPAVDRDLAVLVKSEITVGSMIDCIKSAAGELCERVGLFDIYSGAQIESGFKSVAFSIRLQSQDKTLSDAEIQGVMSRVVAALEEKFSAKLR
ncbi:MAG: phenylalanine--tRNA ligase subunit beta, partial [Firmicutes bacterium]|nr:phenylalanine--tRNA ligase subunit beta [Bacillota bacterium]